MGKYIYNLIPDKMDVRDYLFKDTPIISKDFPKEISLNDKFPFVFDQGQLGSCGLNSSLMYVMYLFGFKIPILSRLYGYYKVREIENTTDEDSGVSLRDVCKMLQKNGCCMEDLFPYVIENFKNKPTSEMDTDAQKYKIKNYHRVSSLDEIKQALSQGFPLLLGINVFEELESEEVAKTGQLTMPENPNNCLGGHAVLCVKSKDSDNVCFIRNIINKLFGQSKSQGNLTILNSWGKDWGINGRFLMPYEYLKYVTDIWVLVLE